MVVKNIKNLYIKAFFPETYSGKNFIKNTQKCSNFYKNSAKTGTFYQNCIKNNQFYLWITRIFPETYSGNPLRRIAEIPETYSGKKSLKCLATLEFAKSEYYCTKYYIDLNTVKSSCG